MVLIGGIDPERITYAEYQIVMFCLAVVLCLLLGLVEVVLMRFQVLQMFFPGMISINSRRFYFFSFDVSDSPVGKRIRREVRMLVRVTFCVVVSYLWQHCVMENLQTVGKSFPEEECNDGFQCFATDFHFLTLITHQNTVIDCDVEVGFENRMVISCVKFIRPAATTWLMHLAIAHSLTQLNFKAFELLVWICGNSLIIRQFFGFLVFGTSVTLIILFLADLDWNIFSSWLSFVTTMACPFFLFLVFRCSGVVQHLWKCDAERVQGSIEKHLTTALRDVEFVLEREGRTPVTKDDPQETFAEVSRRESSFRTNLTTRARSVSSGIWSSKFVQILQSQLPAGAYLGGALDLETSDGERETEVEAYSRARLRRADLDDEMVHL
mmetsp:Transcript_6802/g.18862  ORF Transcript_6802/g.18862 Transcript_6802/m.18862 type:complete len:381 (-) Transcript_6802:158-1300(-)